MGVVHELANAQWASRPVDERFGSIADLHAAVVGFKTSATVETIKANALRVAAAGNQLILPAFDNAVLNSWTFKQVADRAKAPAGYLATLPALLAADCVNDGLVNRAEEADAQLLFGRDAQGRLTARAVTSGKYSRIWNADITSRLVDLEQDGVWRPAPAAFDGSRGLYAGERDMFAFLVDNDRRIFESAPGGGLSRGFCVSNSEVGDGAFNLWTFFYEYICGNHRIWGEAGVEQTKVIHIGNNQASKAWDMLRVEVTKYAEASAADDEAKIERMMAVEIGATKDEVLDAIFKLKLSAITKTVAGDAYKLAEQRVDWYGSPRSVWGYAGALTEIARDMPFAADRNALDVAASKVMELAT
jgi:hypothetical protein